MSFLGWPSPPDKLQEVAEERELLVSVLRLLPARPWGGEAFTFYFIIEVHFETFK